MTQKAAEPQAPRSKGVTEGDGSALRTMEIRVINSRTNQPEPGVTIRVSVGMKKEGATDAEGRYRLTGTAREFTVVRLHIEKAGLRPPPGYVGQRQWQKRPSRSPASTQ